MKLKFRYKNFISLKKKSILYFGLVLIIIKTFLSISQIFPYSDNLEKVLTISSSIFLSIYILFQNYSLRTLLVYIIITFFIGYISYNVGNFSLFLSLLIIFSIRRENLNDVIRFLYDFELFLFLIQFIAVIITSFKGYFYFFIIGGITRYSLGFIHPNSLALYYLNLLSMWIWLNYERIDITHEIVIVIITTLVYALCRTRTLLVEVAFLIFFLSFRRNTLKRIQDKIIFFSKFSFPFIAIIFYFVISNFSYTNTLLVTFDQILSGRIKLSAYALTFKGLSIFGQNLQDFNAIWDSYWQINRFAFDSLYGTLLINYGIIIICLFSIIFFKLAKYNDIKISIFILLFSFFGVSEVQGINCIAYFPLILSMLLFDNNYKTYKKGNILIKNSQLRVSFIFQQRK